MFLTRETVLKQLRQAIVPFDQANLHQSGELTLTLSPTYRQMRQVDLLDAGNLPDDLFTEHEMQPDTGLVIQPGQFVLLLTTERIKLRDSWAQDEPYGCLLATRPKLAQIGLDVLQGSSIVRSGSDCQITLETVNHGPNAIRVYPGMKIVKALFFFMR